MRTSIRGKWEKKDRTKTLSLLYLAIDFQIQEKCPKMCTCYDLIVLKLAGIWRNLAL